MKGIWTDKYPDECFPNTVDWSQVLRGAGIASCAAEVVRGDVTINSPQETAFQGSIQTVWVGGGARGSVRIRCSIVTTDARTLEVLADFKVL